MPFFGKSHLANRERIALTGATWLLVVVAMFLLLIGLSRAIWRIHSHDVIYQENHYGMDPVVLYFHLSVVLSLSIAGIMVLLRRVSIALMVVLIPFGFFANFAITFFNRWSWMIELNRSYADPEAESGFLISFFGTYVDIADYVSLFTILLLAIWYIWILVRNYHSAGSRFS